MAKSKKRKGKVKKYIFLAIVLLALPLTVFISQRETQTRQEASCMRLNLILTPSEVLRGEYVAARATSGCSRGETVDFYYSLEGSPAKKVGSCTLSQGATGTCSLGFDAPDSPGSVTVSATTSKESTKRTLKVL